MVPREMKVEHSQGVKAMSDEQLEAAIEAVKGDARTAGVGDRGHCWTCRAGAWRCPGRNRGRGEKAQAGQRQGAITCRHVISRCGGSVAAWRAASCGCRKQAGTRATGA